MTPAREQEKVIGYFGIRYRPVRPRIEVIAQFALALVVVGFLGLAVVAIHENEKRREAERQELQECRKAASRGAP